MKFDANNPNNSSKLSSYKQLLFFSFAFKTFHLKQIHGFYIIEILRKSQ